MAEKVPLIAFRGYEINIFEIAEYREKNKEIKKSNRQPVCSECHSKISKKK